MKLLLDTHAFLWWIAQALEDGLTLVTADAQIARYAVRTVW